MMYSSAGEIRFRPRKKKSLQTFRDVWLNKFEHICWEKEKVGIDTRPSFKRLYKEIRKDVKVKWKANIRTRLKNVL